MTLVSLLFAPLLLALAPQDFVHTRSLAPGADSPPATIDQLAWLEGAWRGTGLGGESTETYSAPTAGQIAGHFTQSENGRIAFYELIQIVPQGDSLAYRLRHFNADLTGWEDKDGKAVVFPLVAITPDAAYFDGLTYRRTAPDTLEIWVRIDGEQGVREERFVLRKH